MLWAGSSALEKDMTQVCGLYTVKDEYFARFDKNHLMLDNKEEKRPYYCGLRADNGLLWLIPLSSKIEKYSQLIERYEVNCGKGKCVFCYIAKLKGKKSAFVIGDAIPCTDRYILKPFTVGGEAFVIRDKTDIKNLRNKLSRFLSLVRIGKLKPYVDILAIEKELLEEL